MSNATQPHNVLAQRFSPLVIIQLAFYPVIFLFGITGNLMVLLVIRNKKKNRKVNDYFIFNLALADLTVLAVSIPVDFSLKFTPFPIGLLLCKVLWPLMTIGLFASIFTLTVMAMERWRSIAKPLSPRLRLKQVIQILLLIWAAATSCVIPLVVVAHYDGKSCQEAWPHFSMRRTYTAAVVALQYFLPLILISIACKQIVRRLKWRHEFRRKQLSFRRPNSNQRRENVGTVNKNLRTIVALFAVFMLPKQIAWLWLDFGNAKDFEHIFRNTLIFSELLLYIHSSINPVVYGTILKDYKSAFRGYLRQTVRLCCVSLSEARVCPDREAEDTRNDSFLLHALHPSASLLASAVSPQLQLHCHTLRAQPVLGVGRFAMRYKSM